MFSKERLTELLEKAAKAHHEYEKKIEGKDEQWAEWYAEYILNRIDKEE